MASGNVNIGFVDKRNSSRVLKPPGGGYSDIFGTQDVPQYTTPRSKISGSQMHDIFSTEHISIKTESRQKSQSEENSVARKLNETDSNGTDVEKQNEEENGDSNNIVEGVEKLNVSAVESDKDSNENQQKNETNGSVISKSQSKDSVQDIMNENGNVPATNGASKIVVDNISSKPDVVVNNTPRQRSRVPPGGYSSGLW